MKNKLLLIGPIIVGICLGIGVYFYGTRALGGISSFTAGWSDWVFGGLDCAEKIANCTANMSECQRKVQEEKQRCGDQYNKSMVKCQNYQNKSGDYYKKCDKQKSQCFIKAQKYTSKPDKYSAYISRCEEVYITCQARAEKSKISFLQKAADCRQRAVENKNKCENRYIERQARNIESCNKKGRNCLKNLINKCGPLVPPI